MTAQIERIADLLADLERLARQRKLYRYRPYGHPETLHGDWSRKPWQLDFHSAGAIHQERMLMAANRVGKTECAAAEVAFHMTGEYPEWWSGKRFDRPVLVWTGSPTNETSRDIVQKALLGGTDRDALGTGFIPADRIYGKIRMRQAGVSDVVDSFKVRHKNGVSQCILKTYEQGWRKWQGTQPEIVWMDEEPEDFKIFTEALTRLLTSSGTMMVTFTPLLGQTDLVSHFQSGKPGIYLDGATWEDAPHLSRDDRERMRDSYPDHEQQARTMGVPMMGQGRVFTVSEDDIRIDPFEIPFYFARIKGIDFGLDHPSALADLAIDRDKDIIYVTRVWRKKNAEVEEHAEAINTMNPWVPVAWPHDGTNRERSNGKMLKDHFIEKGVKMLGRSACYKNDRLGSQPIEPIVSEIQQRTRDGSFKVFSTCHEFFDEYRNFHRDDQGRIVKRRDDVLKAVFYAVMMRRYASAGRATAPITAPAPLLSMRR